MTPGLMLATLLAFRPDGGVVPTDIAEPEGAQAREASSSPSGPAVHLRGAAEGQVALLPSGHGENALDLFLSLRPCFGVSAGDAFLVEVGPTFRLRIIDLPPPNRPTDFGGLLRRADWDELSDYGQLLQSLTIATEASPFFLRAGVVQKKTLGLGHLLSRYSNQENPDYHPAGGTAVLAVGPIRAEAFASDVLGGRLFAGELAWDLGRTFSTSPGLWDRFGLAMEAAHDFGRAGLPFRSDPALARVGPQPATLLQLDGWAVLLRTSLIRAMLEGGVGSRVNAASDLGFVVGGAVDLTVSDVGLSVKAELRKQAGGFRQGFFGPSYELSRFADLGFTGAPIAAALLPNGFSFYGEARVGVGTALSVDAAVEHFFWGRTDLDATANVALFKSWLSAQIRLTAVGLGQRPRFAATGSVRARLFSSFYLLAAAGTVFFPQPDGALVRGVTGSAGVGVDFER